MRAAETVVRNGSKCEELNLSKSSPPCLNERTSAKCAATSLMCHKSHHRYFGACIVSH
jgi:hypothetical protein